MTYYLALHFILSDIWIIHISKSPYFPLSSSYDNVEVFDGKLDTDPGLGRFCGSKVSSDLYIHVS